MQRRGLIACAAAASLAVILAGSLTAARLRGESLRPRAMAASTPVTITVGADTASIPRSFFGLSTEYFELPLYENHLAAFERLLAVLHLSNDGPTILRIGGDSADQTYWNPGSRRLPAGSFVLSPAWIAQTSQLVSQANLRVILDFNLEAHSTSMAASLAQTARAHLPAGSIVGFEVGNEPDRYKSYSIPAYVRDFRAYGRALTPIAPGVPLMGPAITSTAGNFNWLVGVVARDRPELGILSGHRYPLAACAAPDTPGYPTIAKVLSEATTSGMAQSVSSATRLAHQAKRPFRLDELNSVTCGGQPGVSNTFATALWAPDALFEVLRTRADGVNLHIRPTTINGPVALSASGLLARPLLYGMALFVRTVGSGRRLVALHTSGANLAHVKAWGVREPAGGLHVLVVNKGKTSANVDLRVAATGTATVERLLGPSASATSGVTLAGQKFGADGKWLGPPLVQSVPHLASGYHLAVPGLSAALVSLG